MEIIIMQATTNSDAPKAYKGMGMEGFIANWYARQTGKNPDEFKKLARQLSSRIKPGDRVLEVAPGPGYLAIELFKLTRCRMIGLDISRTFVAIANANAEKDGVDVCFEQGDAADMPYPANAFNFIVCRAAFKNFARPLAALNEMYRVLKPGGTAFIIDLRKDFSPQAIRDYTEGKGLINGAIIKLTFNTMLKKRAYTQEGITKLASQSQFGGSELQLDPIGFELWLHKAE
jgi:ubiquinone/menaquinone biosynthesis C-methylase UbiE